MNEKITNKSNWFLVEVIERCEPVDSDLKQDLRRCTVWGNYHLIKAATPELAYEKAAKIGKKGDYVFTNSDKTEMKWEFVGISNLLPIYEDIEDGVELMWSDYGFISARRAERMVVSKDDLLKSIKLKK